MAKTLTFFVPDEQFELIEEAVHRSSCSSRSEFLRDAALVVADQVLAEHEEAEEPQPKEEARA